MTKLKTQSFLVNKLDTGLSLKGGYLTITPKGFVPINEQDNTEASVLYALGRDWAEIVDKEPSPTEAIPEVEIYKEKPFTGMTLEELREAELNEVKKPGVTSSAIGVPQEPEAKVDVPTVEVFPEPKTTKKAKA